MFSSMRTYTVNSKIELDFYIVFLVIFPLNIAWCFALKLKMMWLLAALYEFIANSVIDIVFFIFIDTLAKSPLKDAW